ncbi:MAG: sulfatase-like hydrolase/transferase, partial [Verrucomicrobiota bacterium]
MKRVWTVNGAVVAVVVVWATGLIVQAGEKRPNVLFLAFDDLRPEIGAYGAKEAITPNMDQLASEGTVFANAYVNYPLCLPSRASLISGIRFDNRNFTDGDKAEMYRAMLTMQPG